jgi:polyvinyl alcohol dehydrogenase (cytochrome)
VNRLAKTLLLFLLSGPAVADDGGALYAKYCSACHDHPGPRTPSRNSLSLLTKDKVLQVLENGSMRVQGADRTAQERDAIAAFLLNPAAGTESRPTATSSCNFKPARLDWSSAQWNGWGATPVNDRFQRARDAKLKAADVPKLHLKWAFGFPGETTTGVQPSIVGGRVFVGSHSGRVYALDLNEGCVYWTFEAGNEVRTAISVAAVRSGGSIGAVFFADTIGNLYSLDADTGLLRWKRHVDDHPAVRTVGAPRVYAGRVYMPVSSGEEVTGAAPNYECCTFRGSVVALDAETGDLLWKASTVPEPIQPTRKNAVGTQLYGPSGAGVWTSPTIDERRNQLYVTTGDSYSDPPASTSDSIVAFDLGSGAMRWAHQATPGDAFNIACNLEDKTNCPVAKGPDFDFASPPILVSVERGKRLLVAGQKSGLVYAVDPDDAGRLVWSARVAKGGLLGGVMWGSASDGHTVYVAISDYVSDGKINPNAGGMVALRLTDGKEMWRTVASGCKEGGFCSPAQGAAVTLIPGAVFSGSRDGHLRAYATDTGRVIWDFDTGHEFLTVNGVEARGGSIDSGGPAVAAGVVLTTSGYSMFGGMGGNVLLAFAIAP